jgi:Flp pilus assembly pilin Flp
MYSYFFLFRPNKGQGLVEYAIILALVAIVVIAILIQMGPKIGNTYSTINSSLGFESAPTVVPTATPNWVFCSNEFQYCSFSGTKVVRYGKNNTWVEGTFTNGVDCSNSVFGDPLVGTLKECDIKE